MQRRSFLLAAGASLAPRGLGAAGIPVIDTHIHLFDTNRPQGVPWPGKDNKVLFQPALPDRYRRIATPLGVVGAIKVEASPWIEDNQWVLDLAAEEPIIVGVIGNLDLAAPEFGAQLDRFQSNPLFRGIRYGNLWGRDLAAGLGRGNFVANLKLLSAAGLTLDTANPNPDLIAAIVRLTGLVPDLRVVIDHLPQMRAPDDRALRRKYQDGLRELGQRPRVFVKLSAVFRRIGEEVPRDLSVYRATLDEISAVFGEDRVLFGSDWPNSDQWRPYADVLGLVREYFASKSPAAAEKYFWRNSVAAYRWRKRDPSQPGA
ncbi:MAG: amidohydrolase family protein [Bryobacteraceae bacterium]|nr:amidohydrolase family protein [Bryobacteraceae bacterium]